MKINHRIYRMAEYDLKQRAKLFKLLKQALKRGRFKAEALRIIASQSARFQNIRLNLLDEFKKYLTTKHGTRHPLLCKFHQEMRLVQSQLKR